MTECRFCTSINKRCSLLADLIPIHGFGQWTMKQIKIKILVAHFFESCTSAVYLKLIHKHIVLWIDNSFYELDLDP